MNLKIASEQKGCQHCGVEHNSGPLDDRCPLSSRCAPVLEYRYGANTVDGYRVSDNVRYKCNGQEKVGTVIWGIGAKQTGNRVKAYDKTRYLIGRDGQLEGDIVDKESIIGRVNE